jgi:hypothetical protein
MLPNEQGFLIVNNGIIVFWLLLALLPFARVTKIAVHSAWLPLLLAAIYTIYLSTAMSGPPNPDAGYTSLAGVMALFTSPTAVVAGWVHYLVFDLFIGAWEVRDARRRGIPHLAVVPCLFLTFMFGPVGLGAYLLMRGLWKGAWSLDEDVRSASTV